MGIPMRIPQSKYPHGSWTLMTSYPWTPHNLDWRRSKNLKRLQDSRDLDFKRFMIGFSTFISFRFPSRFSHDPAPGTSWFESWPASFHPDQRWAKFVLENPSPQHRGTTDALPDIGGVNSLWSEENPATWTYWWILKCQHIWFTRWDSRWAGWGCDLLSVSPSKLQFPQCLMVITC